MSFRIDYQNITSVLKETMEQNCALIAEHGIHALTIKSGYELQVRGYGRWAFSVISSDQNAVMEAVIRTLKAIQEEMAPPPIHIQKEFPVCFFRKIDVLPTGPIYSTVPFSAVLRRVKEFLLDNAKNGTASPYFGAIIEGTNQCTKIYSNLDFGLKKELDGFARNNLNFFIRESRMAVASKAPLDKEQVVKSVVAQMTQELGSTGSLKIDPYGLTMPNIMDVLTGAWAARNAKHAVPEPYII